MSGIELSGSGVRWEVEWEWGVGVILDWLSLREYVVIVGG